MSHSNCSHTGEPDCAIALAEAENVHPWRLASLREIYRSVSATDRRQPTGSRG